MNRIVNTKSDKLIGLEPLGNDSVGEWIIDKEHKGTEDDPIHFPYPMYVLLRKCNSVIQYKYKNCYFYSKNSEKCIVTESRDLVQYSLYHIDNKMERDFK